MNSNNKLGRKRKGVIPTTLYSSFKTYCSRCHYTIWKNEKIQYDGKAWHFNCKNALLDETPRILDPNYLNTLGNVNKKKLKTALKG